MTIFTLFREDFDPSIAPDIRAFDARGEPLLRHVRCQAPDVSVSAV